jgi:hypothetical protein
MNRIRFGLFITMILGAIYAFSGLLTSVRDFAVGLIVVSVAVIIHGLITYVHERQDGG